MLYVTTRSKNDAFTAPRTMSSDQGPDGGLFVPFRLNAFNKEEILALGKKSFGQNLADILNLFFSTKLTSWDVEVAIGRVPYGIKNLNYRIISAELWHNPEYNFTKVIKTLARLVHPDGDIIGAPSNWTQTAVRIAALFGLVGELLRTEQVRPDQPLDIALPCGDFSAPMAAWYARKMGLPIGNILIGCQEKSAVWDLLHRGQIDTGVVDDEYLPDELERLICETCGQEEAMKFRFSCAEGGSYVPSEVSYAAIRGGMFAAVVSQSRLETTVSGFYRTNEYILDPYSAFGYSALSDYRARNGSSRSILMICERSPICSSEAVCEILRISVDELKKRLSML